MGLKFFLIYGLLALVMVAKSANASWSLTRSCTTGNGCIAEDDENEFLMGSETNRRQLAQRRYISYGALRANNVPCNRRGNSYYNCKKRTRANPYKRGCSVITHCHRFTS